RRRAGRRGPRAKTGAAGGGTGVPRERPPAGPAGGVNHGLPRKDRAATVAAAVGLAKSPPTATPASGVRNARANTPAVGPVTMGVVAACQVRPPSREANTRATVLPPLPNQASFPNVVRPSPLAANPASPGSASGIPAFGSTVQLRPPSRVDKIRNLPFTGSLSTRPCRELKNAMQSKNACGLVFW